MEFVQIFTQMNWISALLLILGIVFMIIEIFISGFGFFGFAGIGLLIAGTVVRICQGLNVSQSLTLVLMIIGHMVCWLIKN